MDLEPGNGKILDRGFWVRMKENAQEAGEKRNVISWKPYQAYFSEGGSESIFVIAKEDEN